VRLVWVGQRRGISCEAAGSHLGFPPESEWVNISKKLLFFVLAGCFIRHARQQYLQ